jgi:methylated-DNA-[protein]-cysteine S-methyltransferase
MNKAEYTLFETPIGICGIGWTLRDGAPAVSLFQLPESTREATEARIGRDAQSPTQTEPPAAIKAVIAKVLKHLNGQPQDFRRVPLDLDEIPAFTRSVYSAALEIPAGQTRTYGDLAKAVGNPDASRAIGQALGSNPIPLIVPCHRILAAGGKSGGFSAHGGTSTKSTLLALEGVVPGPHATIKTSRDLANAVSIIRERDPTLERCFELPFEFNMRASLSPYASLFEAIVHQQLSTRVVTAILGRVKDLYQGSVIPEPEDLLNTPDQTLRDAGLSGAKVAALKDLAAKALNGTLPTSKEIVHLGDDEVMRRLTEIRGVGRWTVEMLLIFNLGRMDVFPVDDLVIRKAYAEVYGLETVPTAKQLLPLGDIWRPYRTVASLYLWNFIEPQEVTGRADAVSLEPQRSLFAIQS